MGPGSMHGTKLFGFVVNVLFPYILLPVFLVFLGYVLFFVWPTIWPLLFKQP